MKFYLTATLLIAASASSLRSNAAPSCTPAEACQPSDATVSPQNLTAAVRAAYEASTRLYSRPSGEASPPPGALPTGHKAIFQQDFVAGNVAELQCNEFANTFIPSLQPGHYNQITFAGSRSEVVGTNQIDCADAILVNGLAQALKENTAFAATCTDSRGFDHLWSLCPRHDHQYESPELWIDAPDLCSSENCPNPGWALRPVVSVNELV